MSERIAILREYEERSARVMRWMRRLYGIQLGLTLVLLYDVWRGLLVAAPILAAMVGIALCGVVATGMHHRRICRDWDRYMDGMEKR